MLIHNGDHLARLLMKGTGSSGSYTPHRFQLRLHGTEEAIDDVVYLHEVHHLMLNDVTAWGSLLHLYARLHDEPAVTFGELLDVTRLVHESYATFASMEIVARQHRLVPELQQAYPAYAPLHRRTVKTLSEINGPMRRQLAVNAMARVCMQSPVLTSLVDLGASGFTLSHVRTADLPDERWRRLGLLGSRCLAEAARAADMVCAEKLGISLSLDADEVFDDAEMAAYDTWEEAIYQVLSGELIASGSQVMGMNDHQEGTAEAIRTLGAQVSGVRAAGPDDPLVGDGTLAAAVLQQVRQDLDDNLRTAAMISYPLDELTREVRLSSVIDRKPCLFIDVRRGDRLGQHYNWRPGDTWDEQSPVCAVRLIAGDEESNGVIAHQVLDSPESIASLVAEWRDRGPVITCLAASCLADRAWVEKWVESLPGRVFVLIDLEPQRFSASWSRNGLTVLGARIAITDTSGQTAALLLAPGQGRYRWMAIAHDISIGLLTEALQNDLGAALDLSWPVSAEELADFKFAATHLLATESFASFDGLG